MKAPPYKARNVKTSKSWDFCSAPIVHGHKVAREIFNNMRSTGKFKSAFEKPKDLTIVMCHNYSEKTLLERNLDYLGIKDYTVLHDKVDPWRSTLKLLWFYKFLTTNKNIEKYILFCDADDVIFRDNPEKIIDIYKLYNCKLLFNSTSARIGYACMSKIYNWANKITKSRRYLNSGVYIGTKKILIQCLKTALKYVTEDSLLDEEDRALGRGKLNDNRLCEKLKEYPKGAQDQDIFRYIQPEFYPDLQVDFTNKFVYRNGPRYSK